MKKTYYFMLLTLLCVFSLHVQAQAFSGGTGIESDPFLIATTADLMELDSAYSSENPASPELVYFKMIADVDLAGETWTPFNASSGYNKHVHFDGDGHVIKNMTVTGNYAGMFGVLCGTVKNLGIIDATVTGSSYHGVIAGYLGIQSPASAAYTGLIENCYTTGTLETTKVRGGGIVGYIGGKYEDAINTIRNCYSTVNISSTTTTIGGIAGAAMNAFVIENSYSTGKLITTGGGYVAGILAQQRNGDAASQLKGCVVRNDSLIADNADAIKTGRVSGSLYGNTVVTDNLASDNIFIQLTNEPTYLTEFNETEIIGDRYDGVTTADAALGQQATYAGIGWDFTSTWSPIFHNVYPIHQWLAARADYKEISGFTSSSDASLTDVQFNGSSTEVFSPETYSYEMTLPFGSDVPAVEDFTVTKSHANATVEITRSDASFPTTITVTVTAEDETTTQTYSILFHVESGIVFAGGTGIESDPYLIETAEHMQSMHHVGVENPVYYKLLADVDMDGVEWVPLNIESGYLRVVHFDGNGHLIKNLTINGSARYSSLFGILRGSCKNLGVVDASIEVAESGIGIIAGYVGLKSPGDASFTGMIENCYTTGTVSGTDAVGGIAGNVGKPFESTVYSGVKNCYSTATVMATKTDAASRVGGIVGINYAGGVIENCYARGTVVSNGTKGAGGIAGWSDTDIVACVSLNDSVRNELPGGNLGRIAANMGLSGDVAQGINCWASEGVIVDNGGVIRAEVDMVTGTVAARDTPYDGETKTTAFLTEMSNYSSILGWDFTQVWTSNASSSYPVLAWEIISDNVSPVENQVTIARNNHTLTIKASDDIQKMTVYTLTGNIIYNKSVKQNTVSVTLPVKGIYVLSLEMNGERISEKVVL